jgi:glutathione peroxidase
MTLNAEEKADKTDAKKDPHPIYGHKMKSLKGDSVDLAKYKGKVLLIVNTASECGATPQYAPLQELHEKYKSKGLVVLGFPCNQFGLQEPGSDGEIAKFCKQNYGVSFDMFSKVDVNGAKAANLYKFLTSKKTGVKNPGPVKWNFEKFLISREGKVVGRHGTETQPDSQPVTSAITAELAK